MSFCLAFVFAALLEFAVANVLHQKSQAKNTEGGGNATEGEDREERGASGKGVDSVCLIHPSLSHVTFLSPFSLLCFCSLPATKCRPPFTLNPSLSLPSFSFVLPHLLLNHYNFTLLFTHSLLVRTYVLPRTHWQLLWNILVFLWTLKPSDGLESTHVRKISLENGPVGQPSDTCVVDLASIRQEAPREQLKCQDMSGSPAPLLQRQKMVEENAAKQGSSDGCSVQGSVSIGVLHFQYLLLGVLCTYLLTPRYRLETLADKRT